MAVQAPVMLRGLISPLQFIAAFAMLITGIFDRVLRIFSPSFILMPVWTGVLIFITAGMGVVVGTKLNLPSHSGLVIAYRALNVLCSILCGIILLWYGTGVSSFASGQLAKLEKDENNDSFAVVAIIFVMALIEVSLCIMAVFASQERNSSYMQLVDPPMEPYDNRTQMHVPMYRVDGSNFSSSGHGVMLQGGPAYQPVPQPVVQTGTPVMMAPAYMNQTATATRAPVMLVPAQNLQPVTSGGGLMYVQAVQVPVNQGLSGNTQVNTSSQVPQESASTFPSGSQSPEQI